MHFRVDVKSMAGSLPHNPLYDPLSISIYHTLSLSIWVSLFDTLLFFLIPFLFLLHPPVLYKTLTSRDLLFYKITFW